MNVKGASSFWLTLLFVMLYLFLNAPDIVLFILTLEFYVINKYDLKMVSALFMVKFRGSYRFLRWIKGSGLWSN